MKDDANSRAISVAKVALDLASFIAMFLVHILSYEKLKYWQAHKNEMKTKLRELFAVVDEFQETRLNWESFYQKAYGWSCDFSHVIIPQKPDGDDWRLLFVAKGLRLNQIYEAWSFPKWRYIEDLDKAIAVDARTSGESYAVWIRTDVEPDAEFLNKSTNQVDANGLLGITLLERMLLEAKYFDETTKHLDVAGATFCSGSRSQVGFVPCVCLNHDGDVDVNWCSPDNANGTFGVRRAVSASS